MSVARLGSPSGLDGAGKGLITTVTALAVRGDYLPTFLLRTEHDTSPEYYPSADDLSFVHPEALAGSLRTRGAVVDVLEGDERLVDPHPYGEPQLGRRGIYRTIGGGAIDHSRELAMPWVLNLLDGSYSLQALAERVNLRVAVIRHSADVLAAHDLLTPVAPVGT